MTRARAGRHRWSRAASIAALAAACVQLSCSSATGGWITSSAGAAHAARAVRSDSIAWVATWMASPQLVEQRNLPPPPGLAGNTLRQVIRISIGGNAFRLRLSNAFSDAPATVRAARVARKGASPGAIDPSTDRALTFGGASEIVIPAGGEVLTDVVAEELPPLAELVVSLYFGDVPANVTGHPGSRTTSFIVPSDGTLEVTLRGATPVERWYFLAGVEVVPTRPAAALVTLGNSITDGRGSGTDSNNRWPDELARRLQENQATAQVAVLNAGIGGNAVLRGGLGPTALDRFERDVLRQAGVRWLIIAIGVNDIGGAGDSVAAAAVAQGLVAAYQSMVTQARGRGIKVFGATILPFAGSQYDSPARESARQAVNLWIRTSGAFDDVIDFDAAMRDAAAPTGLRSEFDTGDHLHPNEAGYTAMAAAIDLGLFGASDLRLSRIFRDHAVLQRDAPLPVRGWAAPGDTIAIRLAGRSATAVAGPDGAWRALLPASPAGGPHEMEVTTRGERLTVRDLHLGDIWVAGGQSNMEWSVSRSRDAEREAAAARDGSIRAFRVPVSWSDEPEDEITGGEWRVADSAHVGAMTAVGYFFARELRPAIGVPIGLLDVSWSGSAIETWLARESNDLSTDEWASMVARRRAEQDGMRQALVDRLGALPAVDSGLVGDRALWAAPTLDESRWTVIPVPGAWERAGFAGMNGIGWYRLRFTLTEAESSRPAALLLGAVDDGDITWMNGREVGRTPSYGVPRRYSLPRGALRAGENVLAVRVADGGGDGGIVGSSASPALELDGSRRELGGEWRFRPGSVSLEEDGQQLNKVPSIAYNQMVHPLLDFPVRGVIWYQGESNANSVAQAKAYRKQFRDLIESWRGAWRHASGLPFLWVQLANFGPPDSLPPGEAAWATLRESQHAALTLPLTGQAIAIDIGEAGDIHPTNKQDAGRRLALVARRVAYGQSVPATGPTYRRHSIDGNGVSIEFANTSGELQAPGGRIGGFALAGVDRRWFPAQARVEGDRVIAWSEHVPAPVAVRYAWSNSPIDLVLRGRGGLPAVPFRTDDW